MKDKSKSRIAAMVLAMVGIIFIIEGTAVLYLIGLFPPFIVQSNAQISQFVTLGWIYGILKVLVGLIAAGGGAALAMSKE